MRQLLPAICLLLVAAGRAALAGSYDEYLGALEKRNQRLHSDYLSGLADAQGKGNFFDSLDGHVSDVQAKHYVRDSVYPSDFDTDRYWTELLSRASPAAAAGAPVRETRGGGGGVPDDFGGPEHPDLLALVDALNGGGGDSAIANRREEEPFLNRIWGVQKVSGGAGEPGQVTGPLNKPQKAKIITDRLPSYCDPPNPCPLNADPKKLTSPCDRGVQDTVEYNYADTIRKMASGQCPCDNEHMECPAGTTGVTSKKASQMGAKINPYLLGNKRDKLDAKKSPRFSVRKRGVHANFRSQVMEKKNPWLDGVDALDTVEKKAGQRVDIEEPLSE